MFQGLFIDGFAGGGGASTGIAQAIGREVDVAINHDPCAIAVHKANHPTTEHHCNDIRAVWPLAATRHREVAGAWFSPDCKEFSKAKGGPVKDRSIRSLAWEVPVWLEQTKPTVAYLENVEEFQDWGPLEQRDDGKWYIIPEAKGREFKKWCRAIRRLGYRMDWRELRACDYGAPTSRKRLYVIMRRDGLPIVWPKRTHAPADDPKVLAGKLKPYRTAAECIDWSIPCPSIFLTPAEVKAQKLRIKRPLEDPTLYRVAAGTVRYVIEAARKYAEGKGPRPFTIPVTHTQNAPRAHDSLEPLRTITTANGGEFMAADVTLAAHVTKFRNGAVGSAGDREIPTVTANGESDRPGGATPLGLVGASLVKMGNGEREGQAPRALDAQKPLGTTTATGSQFAAVEAELAPIMVETAHGAVGKDGRRRGRGHRSAEETMPVTTTSPNVAVAGVHLHKMAQNGVGKDARDPLDTAMAGAAKHGVVETVMAPMIDRQFTRSTPSDAQEPLGASMTANKTAQVSAFLTRYHKSNTNGGRGEPRAPLGAVMAGGDRGGTHHAVVCGHMEQANTGCTGRDARKPMSTLVTKGCTQQVVQTTLIEADALPPEMMARAVQVAAFLVKYYGSEVGQHQEANKPIDAITTKARYAVVTVTIDAVTYVIVDIGLRMLTPRELARAQGFPDSYIIDPECWYTTEKGTRKFGRLPKAHQIRMIGNSVCPDVARALVAANQPGINDNAPVAEERRAAA